MQNGVSAKYSYQTAYRQNMGFIYFTPSPL
jgi:hypothetical protein